MNTFMLTPPEVDDETAVKLNDFLYELLEVFETHYCHQMRRYHRNLRVQQMQHALEAQGIQNEIGNSVDDEELSF